MANTSVKMYREINTFLASENQVIKSYINDKHPDSFSDEFQFIMSITDNLQEFEKRIDKIIDE